MKPSDYHVVDLKNAFEPIAMLTISKMLREMTRNQVIELRIYDSDLLKNINRLFPIYAEKLKKAETYSRRESFWRMIIEPKQQEAFK